MKKPVVTAFLVSATPRIVQSDFQEENAMSQVHNEDIKDLLSYFQVIPDALMKVYLM